MNRIEFYSKLDKYKADKANEEKEQNGGSLSHYGIIGQKWGQRRWQNADGTFNTEGKIRYFGKNGTTKKNKEEKPAGKNGKDQKIGGWYMNSIENAYMTPKTASERAVADLRVNDRIKNETIDSFEYSKKNRLAQIMDGDYFDRLNRMQSALSKGKTEKYNKLLNKFKEEDRELVEDYVKKLNDNINDHRDSYLYDFNNNKEKFYAEIKAREKKAAEDKINQERARENAQDYPKRYNANGEELAHPWDPYDDLTVNQLNEIRQKYGSQPDDQKIGGLFGKKGNDIGTGEHLHEIHELRRQINEFEDAGLDTKSLEKMLKYYENADGYKYGSQPGADEKKKILNDTIKGLFSKKKDNLPDKIREEAKKLREVGEDELADKYEKHAKDMESYRKIGHAPGATEQEIKEARRSAANAYATAYRNKWPLFLIFGPIGGAIIGSIASNAKVNKIIDQLGLDKQDKDRFTAADWDAINEAIKESRRKKPKNQTTTE